ncbi:MAG: magnesium transporter [Blastococcus sp.]|nr:magnesium transporter [Blastococcus sp.]
MDIRTVTGDGVCRHEVAELPELLARADGVLWVDVPEADPDAVRVLGEVFGFHPKAVQDCVGRNPVPKVHV